MTITTKRFKSLTVEVVIPMMLIFLTIGIIVFTSHGQEQVQTAKIIDGAVQQQQLVQHWRQVESVNAETELPPLPPPARKLIPGSSVDFDSDDAPMLAWLLAFPNSGENDIVNFIHKSTGMTTATNYGQNMLSDTGRVRFSMLDSIPVYVSRPRGPFLYTHHLPLPTTTIPTLSFCTGYCNDCYPGRYMTHRDDFIASCALGIHFDGEEGPHGPTGRGIYSEDNYDTKLVERAVVIVRNPYHVLQDRFLQFSRSYERLDHRDHQWLPKFVMNNEGFQQYCKIQGVKFADEESKWYEPNVFTKSLGVPCHADMYRYVQWYNLVFESLDFLGLPYMIVHYEDFDSDFVGVESDMLNFLGLTRSVDKAPAWYPQGTRGLLSDQDKLVLKDFIMSLATPSTLKEIIRYLPYSE